MLWYAHLTDLVLAEEYPCEAYWRWRYLCTYWVKADVQYIFASTSASGGMQTIKCAAGRPKSRDQQIWRQIDGLAVPRLTECVRDGIYLLCCPQADLLRLATDPQALRESLAQAGPERSILLCVMHGNDHLTERTGGVAVWFFWDVAEPAHLLLALGLHQMRGQPPETFAPDWLVKSEKGQVGAASEMPIEMAETVQMARTMRDQDVDHLRRIYSDSEQGMSTILRKLAEPNTGYLDAQSGLKVKGLRLDDFCVLSAILCWVGGNGLFTYAQGKDVLDTLRVGRRPALMQTESEVTENVTLAARLPSTDASQRLAEIDLLVEAGMLADAFLRACEPRVETTQTEGSKPVGHELSDAASPSDWLGNGSASDDRQHVTGRNADPKSRQSMHSHYVPGVTGPRTPTVGTAAQAEPQEYESPLQPTQVARQPTTSQSGRLADRARVGWMERVDADITELDQRIERVIDRVEAEQWRTVQFLLRVVLLELVAAIMILIVLCYLVQT